MGLSEALSDDGSVTGHVVRCVARYRFMGGKLANTIVQVVSAAASCSQSASGSAGSAA
jgi:hypothetical protein